MVILGAGGHASEILDVLIEANRFQKDAIFFFDNTQVTASSKLGFPIIHSIEELNNHFKKSPEFIVGVGSPRLRQRLYELGLNAGGKAFSLVSTTASISSLNVVLGNGLNIMHHAYLFPELVLEDGVLVNAGSFLHHNVKVGKYTEIGPQCVLAGGVQVGSHVQLGAGCIVKPLVQICDHVVIGAGTVVYQDITEPGTYVGSAMRKTS
jgi:sugar O-acyltransferase (sialic acid O-acetyltransferase NeuD family)